VVGGISSSFGEANKTEARTRIVIAMIGMTQIDGTLTEKSVVRP